MDSHITVPQLDIDELLTVLSLIKEGAEFHLACKTFPNHNTINPKSAQIIQTAKYFKERYNLNYPADKHLPFLDAYDLILQYPSYLEEAIVKHETDKLNGLYYESLNLSVAAMTGEQLRALLLKTLDK